MKLEASMDKLYKNIILFDGVCNFCSGIVKFIIKHDKNKIFKFAPLQSDFGNSVLKENNIDVNTFDTFVYLRNNKVHIKSDAALFVLKDLKSLWQTGFIFIFIPKVLRDFVYGIFSKYRYRIFGKKDTCMIPNSSIKDRFLS